MAVPKEWNYVSLLKGLLLVFMFWFCPAFSSRAMPINISSNTKYTQMQSIQFQPLFVCLNLKCNLVKSYKILFHVQTNKGVHNPGWQTFIQISVHSDLAEL